MCWEKGSSHLICFRIAPAWWLVKLKRASLWTNQMKPLHQIHLKALLYSYVQAYRVNCPPRTDSFQSGWIWLQFKIPALRFSLNGKLFAERNFLKTLTSPATLRFQIYRHFLALLQQMCGRKTFYASVCTGPKLKQTKNAHSVVKFDNNCTS